MESLASFSKRFDQVESRINQFDDDDDRKPVAKPTPKKGKRKTPSPKSSKYKTETETPKYREQSLTQSGMGFITSIVPIEVDESEHERSVQLGSIRDS